LIKPEKNEIARRGGLSPFAPKQIFKALFAAPRRREKWHTGQKMTENNQSCPKKANQRQDQPPMTAKPVHVRVNIPSSADLNMAFRRFIPRDC